MNSTMNFWACSVTYVLLVAVLACILPVIRSQATCAPCESRKCPPLTSRQCPRMLDYILCLNFFRDYCLQLKYCGIKRYVTEITLGLSINVFLHRLK